MNSGSAFFVSQRFVQSCFREAERQDKNSPCMCVCLCLILLKHSSGKIIWSLGFLLMESRSREFE